MIKFRKRSYFEKYLGIINEKSRTLKKYDYYIKVPQKYDLKFWLLAALKKKLFDTETPKQYYNFSGNEASEGEIQKMRFCKNKGGILIFPNDIDITKRYAENFVNIFHSRALRIIFQKYGDEILWNFGRRYRGIYRNAPRKKIFNAASNTLEILGLNSIDLINVAVKLAVQLQQNILLIKDLNNETMLILGKNSEDIVKPILDIQESDELTNLDTQLLKEKLNDNYKLCPIYLHSLWEMHDVYPQLNTFWTEDGSWWGK